MPAMSGAPTATTLTPPSSSHGNGHGFSWDFPLSGYSEKENHSNHKNANGTPRYPLLSKNGNAAAYNYESDPLAARTTDVDTMNEPEMLSPPQAAGDISGSLREAHSSDDVYGFEQAGTTSQSNKRAQDSQEDTSDSDDSKWIHRDKLAKIENEELQAAGFVLPSSRSRSRPRTDRSQSQSSSKRIPNDGTIRSRKSSSAGLEPKTPDAASALSMWDLRLPEEVEAQPDPHFSRSVGGLTGVSRIPVAKTSPVPIPVEHLERDTPIARKRENSPGDDEKQIAMPKTRPRANSINLKIMTLEPSPNLTPQPAKRSATDVSPSKSTPTGTRKSSAPAKVNTSTRGKARGGGSKDARNNGRPNTRSGERGALSTGSTVTKKMEGDPPWLVNSYKPDPRLPPDQQLLPTVARRLQQEKWEREGKFGNIYDKEFRPLTDEGYLEPPDPSSPISQEAENAAEWPLRGDAPKSPASPGRMSSYSTMPKIQDPLPVSPLASPRLPAPPVEPARQPEPTSVTRVPDMPEKEDAKQKDGCGCCIVM